MSAPDGTVRLSARVTGRVQGVAFRWHTRERALTLGLSGWVRNEPDGSVRLVAEGERKALEALCDWLLIGPPHARVEEREVKWEAVRGGEEGFRITG